MLGDKHGIDTSIHFQICTDISAQNHKCINMCIPCVYMYIHGKNVYTFFIICTYRLLESVLHLTQGQMIVSYVIADSTVRKS